MGKQFILKKNDWVSFFVNFTAVVLGIAITFIGEGIISRRAEEKKAKEILTLVRDELVSDVEGMDTFSERSKRETYAAEYLLESAGNVKEIPDDSLMVYGLTVTNPLFIIMNNIASGLVQSEDFQNGIKDNSLKIAISEAYVLLDGAKESYNIRTQNLLDLIKQAQNEDYKKLICQKDKADRESLEALLFSPDGIFMMRQVDGSLICSQIEETKSRIDEIIKLIDSQIKR